MNTIKHTYNICSSCDANLLKYIEIQIYSMSQVLSEDQINFYLMYNAAKKLEFAKIQHLCDRLKNVTFFKVPVAENRFWQKIAQHGGKWPAEAYYYILANKLLPETLDRVLYIDAGDVLIVDDIASCYNADFQGKSLLAHAARLKVADNDLALYTAEDMGDINLLKDILRGLVNSGSVLLNLEKMRADNMSYADFEYLIDTLKDVFDADKKDIYWGDQGLLSVAFAGDMAHYDWPEIKNIYYMPYNFCLWFYDQLHEQPQYKPKIIHFAGAPKPWTMCYPINTSYQNGLHEMSDLKVGQAEWYYLWHEYTIKMIDFLKCEKEI